MMEWAKEKGLPLDRLPENGIASSKFGDGYRKGYDEGHKQGVKDGIRVERQRLERAVIQDWAKERGIPTEELPEIFR